MRQGRAGRGSGSTGRGLPLDRLRRLHVWRDTAWCHRGIPRLKRRSWRGWRKVIRVGWAGIRMRPGVKLRRGLGMPRRAHSFSSCLLVGREGTQRARLSCSGSGVWRFRCSLAARGMSACRNGHPATTCPLATLPGNLKRASLQIVTYGFDQLRPTTCSMPRWSAVKRLGFASSYESHALPKRWGRRVAVARRGSCDYCGRAVCLGRVRRFDGTLPGHCVLLRRRALPRMNLALPSATFGRGLS